MYAEDMQEAVQVCAVYADIGDYVLLSPACASWGMFKDYEERGASLESASWRCEEVIAYGGKGADGRPAGKTGRAPGRNTGHKRTADAKEEKRRPDISMIIAFLFCIIFLTSLWIGNDLQRQFLFGPAEL